MRAALPSTEDERGARRDRSAASGDSLARDCLAIVLAGGRGSRLAPLTDTDCKPSVPFGTTAKIVDFTLSNCVHSGIQRIGLVTQFRQHALLRHLQHAWNFLNAGPSSSALELLPAELDTSEAWYCGTADAIYRNLAFIRRHAPRYVMVLAGDHVYRADYREMLQHHVDSGADVTVSCNAVPRSSASRFGIVACGPDQSIRRLVEKPSTDADIPVPGNPVLASMGIYVFNTECLMDALQLDTFDATSSHDFGRDILPELIATHRVVAYPFARNSFGRYWRDVGTLDSYYSAHMDLLRDDVPIDLYDPDWPIRSAQQYSGPTRMCASAQQSQFDEVLLGNACTIEGASIARSVVSSGSHVAEGSHISDSILLPGCWVGANCDLRRVVVQADVELPAGSVIGVHPEQDAKRFPVTEGGIAVVTHEALAAIHAAGELAALCPPEERQRPLEGAREVSRHAA